MTKIDYKKERQNFLTIPNYGRITSNNSLRLVLEEMQRRGITFKEALQNIPKISDEEREELQRKLKGKRATLIE